MTLPINWLLVTKVLGPPLPACSLYQYVQIGKGLTRASTPRLLKAYIKQRLWKVCQPASSLISFFSGSLSTAEIHDALLQE